MSLDWIVAAFTALGGGGLLGWWKTTQPRRERSRAADDAILGDSPVLDRFGAEMNPGRPGLIHRVAELEHGLKTLAEIVADQREMRNDLKNLRVDVDHLKDARAERLVTHAESAYVWKALADRDEIP